MKEISDANADIPSKRKKDANAGNSSGLYASFLSSFLQQQSFSLPFTSIEFRVCLYDLCLLTKHAIWYKLGKVDPKLLSRTAMLNYLLSLLRIYRNGNKNV
jgi:hypothetical protein